MIKLSFLLGLFISMKAFAGYHCEFKLFHTDNLSLQIAEVSLTATARQMHSKTINDFLTISQDRNIKEGLVLNLFVSGWSGEEEISLEVLNRKQRGSSVFSRLISEKVSLRGYAQDTLWFDAFKLDVACNLS